MEVAVYRLINMLTYILYIITAILLIISFIKNKKNTKAALKKAWKAFENILPQLLSIMVLVGLVLAFLDAETISRFIGESSGFLSVLGLGAIGSITLIPGFIAFPLSATLLDNGAGYMQIAVFISTLMMVGIVTIPIEKKYFGSKMTYTRNGLALIFSFAVAIVIGVVL